MTEAARALESLLAFWSDSGVDAALAEAPVDRTLEAARPAPARQTFVAPPERSATHAEPTREHLDAQIAAARTLAADAANLEELKEAIAAFDGCALKATAKQAVFSRGPHDAPLMIIGEAPGADEDSQGAPFVGRAGQLLDRMLAAAGLAERAFITNTVFWRPPGNRTPTPAEQAVCAPFLERAIALVGPGALLLVGGAAAKSLLAKSEGILSLRGRWFEWRSSDGSLEIPALPTLHPAFLLRQPAAKKKSWADLLMLAERLDRPARPLHDGAQ
jgi:DNA polymerase